MGKIEDIAGMTGLPESAMATEAEDAIDEMQHEGDAGSFENDKEARREERKVDVIETSPEDYEDKAETTPPVVEEEEESEEGEETDPVKLRSMLQKTRRDRKKLEKKLSKLERSVALSKVEASETVSAPEIPLDEQAIYDELGIEDPDETLTARQHMALTKKMNDLQASKMQTNSENSRKVQSFQDRVTKSEARMRLEVADYDEVVDRYAGILNSKSPDYDAGIAEFVRTRKDPARAFYDLLPGTKNEAEIPDDSDEDDLETGEVSVDARTLDAMKRRGVKQKTMTTGRTRNSGKTRRPKERKLTETLGVFEQLQDMTDAEHEKFLRRHGSAQY